MKRIYFMFLFLFMLFLPACDSLQEEEVSSETSPSKDTKDSLPTDTQLEEFESKMQETPPLGKEDQQTKRLTWEVLSGDFVGEYSVLLTWRKRLGFKKWLIKKHLVQSGSSKFTEVLEPQTLSWLDEAVKEGQKIQYELWGVSMSGKRELLEVIQIRIPTDMLIEGNQHIRQWESLLNSNKPIGRLVFRENASLQIENKSFKLQVQEVYSNKGVLLSFPLGSQAPLGTKGRGGGHIHITSKRAKGSLHFQLYGEGGGDGQNGDALQKAKKGQRGAQGSPAQYGERISHCLRSFTSAEMCPSPTLTVCKNPPSSGKRGGQGEKGADGKDGQQGGHSSPIALEIQDGEYFQFTLENGPGKGGKGGLGGRGGKGGDGGPGGRDPHGLCHHNSASSGKKGPQGPTGKTGKAGAEGKHSPVCIRIGGIERVGCHDTDMDANARL